MRDAIAEIAEEEFDGDTKLRMLSAVMSTAAWIGVIMLILYQTGYTTERQTIVIAGGYSLVLYTLHIVVTRAPALARIVQRRYYGEGVDIG